MGEGKNLIGVDIGTSSIKVCQLKESRRGHTLTRFGYTALPPQTIVDGQVMDAGVVVESLNKVWRDAKIRQRDVAISVSGQSLIIRKITVPMMTPAELDEQIHWEAEQHIPFQIQDVQVDYQVLRRRPEASQMDLLLVAAKKDAIDEYAQVVRDAKLRPVVCDIDAFTVQNLYEYNRGLPEGQTIALLNVGAAKASFNIISNGVSGFSREITTGGNAVTDEIQKQLSVPFDQAEAYKCGGVPGIDGQPGMVPEQVQTIIETGCDTIAAEIQRSLDFFMATSGDAEVSRILLTGGSAALPALGPAVERRTRIPVEVWNPVERVMVDAKNLDVALLQRHVSQLGVALGLALRKDREVRS
jgi:type IV pilus assembly protein PilM